jgi:hypothetical protein
MPKGTPISDVPASEVKLVNKHYYKKALLPLKLREAKGEVPTVGDHIECMRMQGNEDYFDAFPELLREEQSFFGNNGGLTHELSHLGPQIGHTPQQEISVLYVQLALNLGRAGRSPKNTFKMIESEETRWRGIALTWQNRQSKPASKNDRAVYFAIGLYMAQKCEAYIAQGMEHTTPQEQRAFCIDYANSDHIADAQPTDLHFWRIYEDIIEHAPYQLNQISGEPLAARDARLARNRAENKLTNDLHGRGELASIIGVATGLCNPEDTDYPGRLDPIRKTLIDAGLFFDPLEEKMTRGR